MSLELVISYYIVLVGVIVVGGTQYSELNTSTKAIFYLICLTLVAEISAYTYSTITKEANYLFYHIFNPLQFILLSYYFNNAISYYKKTYIGYIVAALGIIIAIVNSCFFQYPSTYYNTYFLAFESIAIVGLSLYHLYIVLNSDESYVLNIPTYFFTSILLIFWSFTFFYWLAGFALSYVDSENSSWIRTLHGLINIITYTGIGLIFFFYRKLQPARD